MSANLSPLRPRFAEPLVERVDEAGGGFILRSRHALPPYATRITDWVERWANDSPERSFFEERNDAGDVRRTFYGEAWARIRRLAGGLLERGVSAERPLLILSDNGIDHAELTLAAMLIGAPAAPVSPAYSLLSKDFAKLIDIAKLVRPGVVFAADGARFEQALGALGAALRPFRTVVSRNPPALTDAARASSSIELVSALHAAEASPEVDRLTRAVSGDAVAKILFTSGSTGTPKGVVNTHRMLTSNQEAMTTLWPFLEDEQPVVVDWLPWSHTFGGNHNLNLILRHGGLLAIDGGKPTPELIQVTACNLRAVSPTLYFNVPRGFEMLLPLLESDPELRAAFFKRLRLVFYAAASLPQPLWERLERVSVRERGEPVTMVSAWGSTETSPLMTSVHFSIPRAGVIGLPVPGSELRFVPNGEKLEMRVRGPNVTQGYWDRGQTLPTTVDSDGFLATGDAGKLADPESPERGVVFDGRIAENFKLTSGTWVSVGELRVRLVGTAAPLVQDAVIVGHDQSSIGALLFVNEAACRAAAGDESHRPLTELIAHPTLIQAIRQRLRAHNRENPASSMKIERVVLLTEPPSIDAGEITDKGYVNQRAVLARRAQWVRDMYADVPPSHVIDVDADR